MRFKEIINRMFVNFFVIFFLIMFVMSILLRFMSVEEIGLNIVLYNMALSFLTVLPELVFYSKRELNRAELLVRHLVCLMLVITITLTFLTFIGGVSFSQPISIFISIGTVSIVYMMSAAIDFFRAAKSTDQIMKKLKERYK